MVIQGVALGLGKKAIIKKEKEDLENHLLVSLTSVPVKIMEKSSWNLHPHTLKKKKKEATGNKQYRFIKGHMILDQPGSLL